MTDNKVNDFFEALSAWTSICSASMQRVGTYGDAFADTPTNPAVADLMAMEARTLRDACVQLRVVEPPATLAAVDNAVLVAVNRTEEIASLLDEFVSLFRDGDFLRAGTTLREASAMMAELGDYAVAIGARLQALGSETPD